MNESVGRFLAVQPTLENHWRAIILFGRNSASYKFALAAALLELGTRNSDLVTMEELAGPFATHVCHHIAIAPRQGTNPSSRFLTACKQHLEGAIDKQTLLDTTVRFGFENVIDAFHNLGGVGDNALFFIDERRSNQGIRITEEFQRLVRSASTSDLNQEVQARWRLVETAWGIGVNASLIEHETVRGRLFAKSKAGRIDVTSCRDALNGYQKGRCFYCSHPISVTPGHSELAHVDHFIPFVLSKFIQANLNGVWNLVLACQQCNLSKSDAVPTSHLAERLIQRNEFLIVSHHPLRETLIAQTGHNSYARANFISLQYTEALQNRVATWIPKNKGEKIL